MANVNTSEQLNTAVPDNTSQLPEYAPAADISTGMSTPLPEYAPALPEYAPTSTATPPPAEAGRNLVSNRTVTDEELERIASRHGVDPANLRSAVKLYGGVLANEKGTEPDSITDVVKDTLESGAGAASRTFLFGSVQKLHRVMQTNPNMEKALDELNDLITGNQSYAREISALFAPVAGAKLIGKGAEYAEKVVEGPVGKAVGGFIAGSSFGSLFGVGESHQGEEVKKGIEGGLVGGVLGATLPVAAKVTISGAEAVGKLFAAPKVQSEIGRAAEQIVSERADSIAEGISDIKLGNDESFAAKQLLNNINYSKPTLNQTTGKIESSRISNFTSIQDVLDSGKYSISELTERYEHLEKLNATLTAVNESNINAGTDWGAMAKFGARYSDGRQLATNVDRHLGGATDVAGAVRGIGEKTAIYSPTRLKYLQLVNKLAPGADEELARDMVQSTMRQEPVGRATDEFWNSVRSQVTDPVADEFEKSGGAHIDRLKYYLPSMRSRGPAYTIQMARWQEKMEDTLGTDMSEWFDHPDGRRFISEVEFSQGEVTSAKDLENKMIRITTGDTLVAKRVAEDAFFTHSRAEGDIPAEVRDMNPNSLFNRWVEAAGRSQFLPELGKIDDAIITADKAGQDRIVQYLHQLRDGIMGAEMRPALSQTTLRWQTGLEARAEATGKLVDRVKADALPIMADFSQNLYIGMNNPATMLKHILQPYTQIAPEIGLLQGTKIAAGATADIARMMLPGGGMNVELRSSAIAEKLGKNVGDMAKLKWGDLLANEGALPLEHLMEAQSAISDGLIHSGMRKGTEVYNAAMRKSMVIFTSAVKLSRVTTLAMGNRLADALINPSGPVERQLTRNWVSQLRDPGTQMRVEKLIQSGDVAKLGHEIGGYFTAEHMLHFDRASMSQFGREIGPVFRMFTKQPLNTAGKLLYEAGQDGNRLNMVRKYIAPFTILYGAQKLLVPDEQKGRDSALTTLTGSEGLGGLHILDTLNPSKLPFVGGKGIKSTPYVNMIENLATVPASCIAGVAEGNGEKCLVSADHALFSVFDQVIFPVSGKFPTETMPKLMGYPGPDYSDEQYKMKRLLTRPLTLFQMGMGIGSEIMNKLHPASPPARSELTNGKESGNMKGESSNSELKEYEPVGQSANKTNNGK